MVASSEASAAASAFVVATSVADHAFASDAWRPTTIAPAPLVDLARSKRHPGAGPPVSWPTVPEPWDSHRSARPRSQATASAAGLSAAATAGRSGPVLT